MTDGNLNIDLNDWNAGHVLNWRMVDMGVQVYDCPDWSGEWLTQSCKCPDCLHRWEAVAPLGTFGIECPQCHTVDMLWEWSA